MQDNFKTTLIQGNLGTCFFVCVRIPSSMQCKIALKKTMIQGNLGTCGRNILPIRHKRSHDTSSGESTTKKTQALSQNDLITSCSTFPSRTVHMRARQTLQNGCLNMGENIIKKGMCSYQRYRVVFLTGLPDFQYQNEKQVAANQDQFFTKFSM